MNLKIDINLNKSLIDEARILLIYKILCQVLPDWTSSMLLDEPRLFDKNISVADSEEFLSLVQESLSRCSRDLKSQQNKNNRDFTTLEFKDPGNKIIAILRIDKWVYAPTNERWNWANRLALDIESEQLEGVPLINWLDDKLPILCESLAPEYVKVYDREEFKKKNLDRTGGGLRAVGIDISEYLPGLYWGNFFGKAYVDMIGKERLLSAPAWKVDQVGEGVLLVLGQDPVSWDSEQYKRVEDDVMKHIGRKYFYDKNRWFKRKTVAPKFNFPEVRV